MQLFSTSKSLFCQHILQQKSKKHCSNLESNYNKQGQELFHNISTTKNLIQNQQSMIIQEKFQRFRLHLRRFKT